MALDNLNNKTIALNSLSLSTPDIFCALFVDLLSVRGVKSKEIYNEHKKIVGHRMTTVQGQED